MVVLTMQIIGTAFASEMDPKFIYKTEIRGAIQPSTASHLKRMIGDAKSSTRVSAILIELDTPGGMLEPTREIVSEILASEVPVITYVSPSGARAGSAGTFIVAASHIAAMAPTTNIGAATPVGASGEELGETIKNKVSQDAAALLRSISEQRGRPSQALEMTVTEAKSYTSMEALELGIIDVISKIRSFKNQLNVSPGSFINISIQNIKKEKQNLFLKNEVLLKKLGRINSIFKKDLIEDSADLLISGEVFKIYFDKTIDLNLIKDNLTKKQDSLSKDLENISKKLDNKSFIERAPKHIVEQEKNAYNELKSDIDKINITIKSLK